MAQNDGKRLVCSILQFLEEEMNKEETTPDSKESLEVTIQCLRIAYNVADEDLPTKDQKKLIDIFTEACPATAPKVVSCEEKAQAENLKQRGNEMMKEEKFEGAITFYSQAIDIDANSAVYYCNRAAAYTGQRMYDLAISDCRKALEIDPKYSKAYSRMGLTYSKVENYEKAVECYDKAIELDPNNEGYKTNRKLSQDKLAAAGGGMGMGLPPGMGMPPGMEMPAGMPNIANMMSNPAFMNMAQQAMQNPAMREMAMNMVSNLMGSGGPEPSAGGSEGTDAQPDMSQILQMGQNFAQQLSSENPELIEQLRNQTNPNNDDQQPPTS